MLAEMLLVDYVSREFQAVVVSEDISEAERVYHLSTPQIFYYDDFLGQASSAEKLGKNEESRLIKFISRVARSNNKRFILTTREYILQQARARYEKIFHGDVELYKYVLDLRAYTRLERAKIFYNHIYFSGLPASTVRSILEAGRYRRIIDHPNYSPRLIEHVVKLAKIDDQ